MIRYAERKWTLDEVLDLFDRSVSKWFKSNFRELTEPQAYAIPLIHQRKNVLVSSPTGTGKTLTAFISIINELILLARQKNLEDRIYCVYVSPLRALANDIGRNLLTPLREIRSILEEEGAEIPDIRVQIRTGDTSQHERQKMLRKPPHIYITTPESLSLSITAPKMRDRFRHVRYVIVDEIHELAGSKRGVMLSLDLERLQNLSTDKITRIGLSATQAPIEEIAKYLAGYENDHCREIYIVNVFHPKDYEVRVISPVKDLLSTPHEIITDKMYDLIYELVMSHRTTLIFTNTRSGAESVAYKLREKGIESIEVHHGSISKEFRHSVEEKLKSGELKCVVSSTSLELGIDIGYIDLVIQIGSPKSVAKGLQRIGRSGHQVYARPKGVFIVLDPDELIECAVLTKSIYERKIDKIRIPTNCLDVLAQVLVGMSLEREWNVDEAYELVRRSYCYRTLPKEKFIEVLRYLGGKVGSEEIYSKIRFYEDENRFGKKRSARIIYFQNAGTIPDEAEYVVISLDNKRIGNLSERFVEYLRRGDVFVLGSRTYEFLHTRNNVVYVRDAAGKRPTVPSWVGELLPRSFDLSLMVGEFRDKLHNLIREAGETSAKKYLMKEYYLDENCAENIISYISSQMSFGVPTHKNLLIEGYVDSSENYNIIFHFPFGKRVNDALSRAWAYALSNVLKTNVRISVTDDSFMLTTPRYVPIKDIPGLVNKENFIEYLKSSIKNTELFKLRFRHVAARSFMILRRYKSHDISVARQQMRSDRLLMLLHNIENFPVVEETYNEILNILMDVENAVNVLDKIEKNKITLSTLDYSPIPSPFSYGVIFAGISDMVLMEDKSALLRELHAKLLEKIMPLTSTLTTELDPEYVRKYFESKIPKIRNKEDIIKFLDELGFAEVYREKGISIYRYSTVQSETLRKWIEELIREKKIVSVYVRKPVWTSKNNESIFYSLYSKECEDELKKYLKFFTNEISIKDLKKKLKLKEEELKEIIKKLEKSYLISRGVEGFIKRDNLTRMHETEAAKILVEKSLAYLGPLSSTELSYRLNLPESLITKILEDMLREDVVREGYFTSRSEKQYILTRDYIRLCSEYENIKKVYKTLNKVSTIEEYFSKYLIASNPYDVYLRCENFSWDQWNSMINSGEIVFGKLTSDRYGYTSLHSIRYFLALKRRRELTSEDRYIMGVIRGLGDKASISRLSLETKYPPSKLKSILMDLEENLYIIKRLDKDESKIVYRTLDIDTPSNREELIRELSERLNSNFKISKIDRFLGLNNAPVSNKVTDKNKSEKLPDKSILLSKTDPALFDLSHYINERCSEHSNFIILSNGAVCGIKITDSDEYVIIDAEDENCVQNIGEIAEEIMKFYEKDIVVFNFQPSNIQTEKIGEFLYAYGRFEILNKKYKDVIMLVLSKNFIHPARKVSSIFELESALLGLSSDFELWNRSWNRVSLEKYFNAGFLYEGLGRNKTLSYMSMDTASLLCSIRQEDNIDDNEKVIARIIEENGPLTLDEIVEISPLGNLTLPTLKNMFSKNMLVRDHKKRYLLVQAKYPKNFAEETAVRRMIEAFGIVSLEGLSRLLYGLIPKNRISQILKKKVKTNELKPSFIKEHCELFYYKSEIFDLEPFDGFIILDPKDIMQRYLAGVRNRWFIVMKEGEIIGKFRAEIRNSIIRILEKDYPKRIESYIEMYFTSFFGLKGSVVNVGGAA